MMHLPLSIVAVVVVVAVVGRFDVKERVAHSENLVYPKTRWMYPQMLWLGVALLGSRKWSRIVPWLLTRRSESDAITSVNTIAVANEEGELDS